MAVIKRGAAVGHNQFYNRTNLRKLKVTMPRSVTVNDFGGGAKSLQALVGSVDVVSGAYEHTIRMQNRGQDIKASRARGFHPHALPEPYVNLSVHTAPSIQPFA